MPELGVKVIIEAENRRRFPRELPCLACDRLRLSSGPCRPALSRLPGDRGPARQRASAPGTAVSAHSWVPAEPWCCPRCSLILFTCRLGVRCPRCGHFEDE